MSEPTKQFDNNEIIIPFDDAYLRSRNANDGVTRQKAPIGDYTLVVEEIELVNSKNAQTPHVQVRMTARVVAGVSGGVGLALINYYAGSKESPAFMHDRLAAFYKAIGVKAPARRGEIIGRRFDGTVVWELSKPAIDQTTGLPGRQYVNDRLIGERPLGQARGANLNPEVISREAIAHENGGVEAQSAAATPAGGGNGAQAAAAPTQKPWAAPAQPPAAAQSAKPTFVEPPEAEKVSVMMYRAYVQVGDFLSPQETADAKAALLEQGYDPEGAVDPAVIAKEDSVLAQRWTEKKGGGAPAGGGLPGGGLRRIGGRKTGTRSSNKA